jgi:hypothetical protein
VGGLARMNGGRNRGHGGEGDDCNRQRPDQSEAWSLRERGGSFDRRMTPQPTQILAPAMLGGAPNLGRTELLYSAWQNPPLRSPLIDLEASPRVFQDVFVKR